MWNTTHIDLFDSPEDLLLVLNDSNNASFAWWEHSFKIKASTGCHLDFFFPIYNYLLKNKNIFVFPFWGCHNNHPINNYFISPSQFWGPCQGSEQRRWKVKVRIVSTIQAGVKSKPGRRLLGEAAIGSCWRRTAYWGNEWRD